MYEKGEDYTELMRMCKPVGKKTYDKMVGNIRESNFDDENGDDW